MNIDYLMTTLTALEATIVKMIEAKNVTCPDKLSVDTYFRQSRKLMHKEYDDPIFHMLRQYWLLWQTLYAANPDAFGSDKSEDVW